MSAKAKKDKARKVEIVNAKARFKYFVEERVEAGVALRGTEVKSIRAGKAQITEAFARIEGSEAFLHNAYIDEYAFGNVNNHKPTRPRKLLLHRKEIDRLKLAVDTGGLTLIPLRMYFKGALVKVELGLCKGKKLHDKREDMKRKSQKREMDRALSNRY